MVKFRIPGAAGSIAAAGFTAATIGGAAPAIAQKMFLAHDMFGPSHAVMVGVGTMANLDQWQARLTVNASSASAPAPNVAAQPISAIDVTTLDGTNGFRIASDDPYSSVGFSVSDAGDVNGDGFDDVIVGDPFDIPSASFVLFGGPQGSFPAALNVDVLDGTNGFRIESSLDSALGLSVSGAGDINGDGFADLIVGAPGSFAATPYGGGAPGRAYVVYGGPSGSFPASFDLATLDGTKGFRLDGANRDAAGYSVSGAGDVNGDGLDDIIVGAFDGNYYTGSTYIVFGAPAGSAPAVVDLSALDGSTGFRIDGASTSNLSGFSVSGAGDVNGDGIADLVIGAPFASTGVGYAGASYVVFGRGGASFHAVLNLSSLDGSNGFRLDGVTPGEYAGYSVSGAGDVNGDGFADVVVGLYSADPYGKFSAGSAYVVFGGPAGSFPAGVDLGSLNGTNGFRIDGAAAYDRAGMSVSGAEDVNGDGIADLIVGAPGGYGQAGKSYVVFGGPAGSLGAVLDLSSIDGTNGVRLDGRAGSNFGSSVSGAGDVNGDGFADVIVGDKGSPTGAPGDGAYVIFGGTFTGSASPTAPPAI